MKKTLKLMGLCALAVLALAGCKKNVSEPKTTIQATISQLKGGTRTGVNSDKDLVWNNTDQIKVYNGTEASAVFSTEDDDVTSAEFTSTETLDVTDGCVAFYPAADVTVSEGNYNLTLKAVQDGAANTFAPGTYPMYALYDNGNFAFQSPCALLGLPLKGDATIGSIVLTSTNPNEKLSGYYSFVPGDMIFQFVGTTDPYPFVGIGNSVALDFDNDGLQLTDTPTTVYFTLPAFRLADGFTVVFKGLDGNILDTKTAGAHEENLTSAQTILMMNEPVTVNAPAPTPAVPDGAIAGLFSVSATQQVWFSKGNLQYIGSATAPYWQFAEHQWDYLGTNTGQNSTNQNVDRDLFGWGTWTGSAPNPANTSSNDSDYSWDNSDFVKTLQNGSGTWRTLNNDEWGYLFYLRHSGATVTTTSGTTNDARYTHATINTDGTGVDGIILFPDGVTIASDEATSWGDINNTSAYGTKCTTAQWAALEAKGCVFLPAAGRRHNSTWNTYATTVQINGGYYWSSTPDGSDYAWDSYFYSGYVNPQTNDSNRYYGQSVRLVQDNN